MRLVYTDTKLEIQITDGARAGFYLTGWFNDGDCWWKKISVFHCREHITFILGSCKNRQKTGEPSVQPNELLINQ